MIFGFDDPAATGCLPTESSRTRGERPSSASTISALAPSTSSSTGRSCLRWPWNFIPTFGSEPPATTATRWKTPACDEAARDDQRGDRGGAEVLDVAARGVDAARGRRHRLAEVAAAALVAVADRLLAGADDVVDRSGVDAVVVRARAAAPAWRSPCPRGSRGTRPRSGRRRSRGRGARPPRGDRRRCAASAPPARPPPLRRRRPRPRPSRGRSARRADGGASLLGDRAGLRCAEPDEAEVVDGRQQAEELVLGHELADAREAALAVGRWRRPTVAPAGRAGGWRRGTPGGARRPPPARRCAGTPRNCASTSGFFGSSRDGLEPWRQRPGTWASAALAAEITGSVMGTYSINRRRNLMAIAMNARRLAAARLPNWIAVEDRRPGDRRRRRRAAPARAAGGARRAPARARARGLPSGTGCRAWARSAARRRAWRSRRGCTAARWGSLRAPAPS